MINEFTSNSEFKRVVEEQQIKGNRLKHFLKKKGIILLNSKAKDLAQSSYTLFLGSKDLTELQELMQVESNYQKSTMIVLTPPDDEEAEGTLDILLDEVNRYKTIGQGRYVIENINKEDDDNLYITFIYERKVSGKMKLISTKKKTINVHVEAVKDSNEVKIDIRQTDSGDSKEFISFLDILKSNVSDDEKENIFNIKHITLDNLNKNNKIEFFDLVSKYKLEEWNLTNITGITVKKNSSKDYEDEVDVSEDEAAITEEKQKALVGISSAVLKGDGLRTNEFVQTCISEGFIITAMKFKFNHKAEAKSIVVEINFSNSDIRIDINKTYLEEEGKEYIAPLSFREQDQSIKLFQDVAYKVYSELLEKQKEDAIRITM